MVKKNEIKKVIQDILKWGQDIEYPLNPDLLEHQWENTLLQTLTRHRIDLTLNDTDTSRIRNSTIDVFLETNLESIKETLEKQIDEEIKIFEIELSKSSSNFEFLKAIGSYSEIIQQRIIDLYHTYMNNTRSKINISEILSKLVEKIIETSKIIKPSYYMSMDAKMSLYINQTFLMVFSSISNILHLTSKEQYIYISRAIEIECCKLNEYCNKQFFGFPDILSKQYGTSLKNFITEEWMKARDKELLSLEGNFCIFLETILDKISIRELAAFDSTICNIQCRNAIAQIAIALFPEGKSIPNDMLEKLWQLLNVNSSVNILNIRNQVSLEYWVEVFLSNSDQVCRFFCIISIVLILSGTYSVLIRDEETIFEDYEACNREWIRLIINTLFQRKYENILDFHPMVTEWTLVLITEQSIIKRIPWWRRESNTLDLTDFLREGYIKKDKSLSDSIANYSEKMNSKSIFQKTMFFASKVVKGITPSKPINDFSLEIIKDVDSLNVTITISGWLSQEDEMDKSWMHLLNFPQQARTYALRWESGSIETLKKKEIIKTLFHTTGLIAAAPIKKLGHLLMLINDNPFKKRSKNAEITGKLLAELIASKKLGNSCISLIGFSLGTRVIFWCLRKLKKLGCSVHDVILLGGAAPCDNEKWKICKSVVSGRLINTYSKTDKILSNLYTLSTLEKAIGNWPIEADGIENYDVTDIATGHLKYREVLDLVLRKIEYNIK